MNYVGTVDLQVRQSAARLVIVLCHNLLTDHLAGTVNPELDMGKAAGSPNQFYS